MRSCAVAMLMFCAACGGGETAEETVETGVTADTAANVPAPDPNGVDTAFEGYDSSWYISYGWPGEYPPGFSITADNVTIMGRDAMALDAPVDQACPLDRNAVYQQWNQARVDSDELEFRTASKISEITFPTGGSISAIPEADESFVPQEVTLDIPENGSIGYLRYVAEGYFLMDYNGEEYQALEEAMPEDAVFEQTGVEDDLWVRTNCTNGSRVWLTLSDALQTDGTSEWEIQGYGEASDLAP